MFRGCHSQNQIYQSISVIARDDQIICARRNSCLLVAVAVTTSATSSAGAGKKVKAYLFNGYWEDIGTMKSFFDANLALAQDPPKFEFFDPEGPIITSPRFLPPARITNCKVEESIISHGAFVSNSTITSAIVGVRSRVRRPPHCAPFG